MNENHNVNNNEENSQEIYDAVSNLINELVKNTTPSHSSQAPVASAAKGTIPKLNVQSSDGIKQEQSSSERPKLHSNPREIKPTYEIYRAFGQFSESQSDVDVGYYVSRFNEAINRNKNVNENSQTIPPVPPSYSSVIKQGRPSLDIRRDVRSMEVQHLNPFTRIPPPSYAEIQGVWSREMSNASSEQVLLGPEPIYIWCTHCATVVITVTQSQRSKFTHLTAAALCLFGCWPCAMLPYCMDSCKNIYHYCPDCNYLFGMYRPW